MHDPHYAFTTFRKHFQRSCFSRKEQGFVALEYGPGDSLFSAIVAKSHGASRYYLIDAGRFATEDFNAYLKMLDYLQFHNFHLDGCGSVTSLEEVLDLANACYATNGLCSLSKIPSGTIDFIWSNAVLEHIRRDEFFDTMREFRRVLRPDGICSHTIDLRDHLGGALNNMRFSSQTWEADWMVKSGFYTNRLRYSEMLHFFGQAGFAVEVIAIDRWNYLPTPRAAMATEFLSFSDEDLLIREFDVLLHPKL
jgi:SAM-dependent methyltransferase